MVSHHHLFNELLLMKIITSFDAAVLGSIMPYMIYTFGTRNQAACEVMFIFSILNELPF